MRSGTSLRSRKEFVKIVKGVFSVCYGNFCRATLRLVKMKRPSGLSLLAGALLLLMPALAVLQFRWVGQVSDAEQERMRRNVEIAAQQFRESFSQEVGRAWAEVQVRAAAVREWLTAIRDSEDLVNVGAYVEGSNQRIDAARSRVDALNAFLCQDAGELCGFADALGSLGAL